MSNEQRTVVIGGGLTGLAAAVGAAEAGERVLVLERSGMLGGRGRSAGPDGFALNLGAHALYPESKALLARLGVHPRGARPSPSGLTMRVGDALHPLPAGPLSFAANGGLTAGGKWALARHLSRALMTRPEALDDLPVTEWLQPLPPDARRVMEALVRLSSYANAPDRLSAGVAMRQIRAGVEVDYLDGGWQTVVDALRARALELGVEIRLRASVEALEHDGHALTAVHVGGERIAASSAVLTLSPKATVGLLGAAAPPALADFATRAAPSRAACLDIALRVLPRPHPTLVLGLDRPSYLSVHSRTARLAPEGGAVIHLVRYLAPGEHIDSAAVRAELEAELDDVQPGWRQQLVEAQWLPAMTVMHAIPDVAAGGLAGRPKVDATGLANVTIAGDWVGPRGLLLTAGLASASEAVARLSRTRRAA